ncbi:hypothetical protein ACFIJ5_16920 [Haloimpatiens sp. FM7330]|uniref:hypothetical protein n=1 Tax=Haloimpatiens sp. FM7330 TaxID=3298610 RepID=UPI00362AD00F
MERRSGFLTFLAALIPGVGYMYLGLLNMGIQALLIFLLIGPLFSLIGLGALAGIFKFALWLYTFFDTFNIAHKIDRGENINDCELFFRRYNGFQHTKTQNDNLNNDDNYTHTFNKLNNKRDLQIIGWIFIILGGLAVINKVFEGNDIYYMIKSSISQYFVPVLFIVAGIYILYKKEKR